MDAQNAKRSPSRRNSPPVCIFVTPEEKERIKSLADNSGLSLSAYGRTLCLSHIPRSVIDARQVDRLMKLNADQGRVGGLLKLLINRLAEADGKASRREVDSLLYEIRATQNEIRSAVKRLIAG
ncbi:MAG: conjugal transfer protein TraJ [Planctomycetota bacterium]|jgi:hypothetical protein|nr:conjugal transfer protein TraJ [Planctomycetota bacterium]